MVQSYRVEQSFTKKGTPRYFLVKEIRVGKRTARVRKYLASKSPPTAHELDLYKLKYATELELKAIDRAAKASSDRYSARYLSKEGMERLEVLRYLYKSFAEILTVNEIEKFEEEFEINYIQGTTSIEGNTLTIREAYDLLANDIIPSGRALREINEVQNFKRLIEYRDRYIKRINLNFIKNIHSILMNNIDNESAGVLRRSDLIGIVGCDLRVTPCIDIEDELKSLIDSYYRNLEKGCHPFEEAVLFHYNFEMIHPFSDGNGRVGRELFNYLLTRDRPPYPKLLFLGKDRSRYIKSFQLGNAGNHNAMVSFFEDLIIDQRLEVLKKSFEDILRGQKVERQMRLSDFVNSR